MRLATALSEFTWYSELALKSCQISPCFVQMPRNNIEWISAECEQLRLGFEPVGEVTHPILSRESKREYNAG